MTGYLGGFSNKIEKLNQKTAGTFTFGVQSDIHHFDTTDTTKARNLAALSHFVEMDFIANLGDLIRGYSVEDIDSPENMRACMDDIVNRYLAFANCPVMLTVGNHDTNSMWCNKWADHTAQITPEEQVIRVFAPLKEYNGDKMVTGGDGSYYYMDFPGDSIRVIMLNTSNGTYDGTKLSSTSFISEEQVEWFKTEALNTELEVIVMSHIPFSNAVPENSPAKNSQLITDAVEEFIKNGGKFITYISGHKHGKDFGVDENGRLHIVAKQAGERANIFSIDRENKLIYIYGLGNSTEDRVFDYAGGVRVE